MKTTKIMYWAATTIIGLMMVFSAYAYLTDPTMEQGFSHMGYPSYFRVELAIAKLIGAILLLAPVASRIKEWAYAGFTFTFMSAFIAHIASGDPTQAIVMPLIFLALLATSYITYHKLGKSHAHSKPLAASIN
jgi:uncharacterized membrane protein YphA (DoxX/SURF4 family)